MWKPEGSPAWGAAGSGLEVVLSEMKQMRLVLTQKEKQTPESSAKDSVVQLQCSPTG